MSTSRLISALFAPTGVVAAHALAYGAAHGWEHERQVVVSGHGTFAVLAAVALPLGLAGLLLLVATSPTVDRPVVRQQASVQVATFTVALFVERVLGVEPLVEVLHDPAVWLAVTGQVVTAALVVALVRAVDFTLGRCVAQVTTPLVVHAVFRRFSSAPVRACERWLVGATGLRGPPVAAGLSTRT